MPPPCCTLLLLLYTFRNLLFFSVYILLCILFCALLRAILICIFIPWPAERAAQHIFRLYAYYNARDRRTEREVVRERETDNRRIRCVGEEGGKESLKQAEPALTIS